MQRTGQSFQFGMAAAVVPQVREYSLQCVFSYKRD